MTECKSKYEVISNNKWDIMQSTSILAPFITIITPFYNRRRTLQRTIDSVEAQSLKNIEYILIDDGSTELSDDIVINYMEQETMPVMFIKKENGGVHTARNMGYKYARGELIVCIDSDDELLPNACETFWNAWNSIPTAQRDDYWQIKAQCIDLNGNITGTLFPKGINEMESDIARRFFSIAKGEQIGCRVAKVLKDNGFPEPQRVKYVSENVLWIPMENKYKLWGINDVVRIYHTEGNDHLSGSLNREKKTIQNCKDSLWNSSYQINNSDIFITSLIQYVKVMLRYCTMFQIVKEADEEFVRMYSLVSKKANLIKFIFNFPSYIVSILYRKKRM